MVQPPRPIPMFPTYLWMTRIDDETRARMNPGIIAKVRETLAEELAQPEVKTYQTHQQLHRLPEFADLVSAALKAAETVLEAFESEQRSMVMTGCWANLGMPKASHIPHHHPNNFLSGVYYPLVPSGGYRNVFHDPRQQTQIIAPRFTTNNKYNSAGITAGVQAGSLILFPAWLTHSVPANQGAGERLSIAFNLNFTDFTETVSPPRWEGAGIM